MSSGSLVWMGGNPKSGNEQQVWTRKSSLLFWLQVQLTRRDSGEILFIPLLPLFFQPQPLKALRATAVRVATAGPKSTLPLCLQELFPRRGWGPPILSHFCHHLAPHVGAVTGMGQHRGMEHPLSVQRMGVGEGVDTECWEVLGRLQKKEELGQGGP